ncbi:MAG: FKBP-type peptidyl-prolyl cis-trans isomerase [Thermoplasmatales archaeon]|nr:FKBP-type peptidyl-prolyl cis-trans isomerase [Thermoplasmatales archaeon]
MREGHNMDTVKEGLKVKILFEAKLEDGQTVLKTEEENPLELTVGEGTIPKSLDAALVDMKVGESKTMTLEPEEAFGPVVDDLIIELPKDGFGNDTELEAGSRISINSPEGKNFIGTIVEVKDDKVKADFNHPLAGRSLVFTVTIISID